MARVRAFTLIEVLLAVGAAAIIAVGIAAVFATTGDVISGGRQVSNFSRYAAQIEAQMRADAARMTRDGYLIIRNEEAYDGQDIATFADQFPDQHRPRRIDELMFFTRGEYKTAREALIPGFVARADAARIYYGHTTPVNPMASGDDPNDPNSVYNKPEITDVLGNGPFGYDADSVFGVPRDDLAGNPVAYAADWTLARHVLLLTQPRATLPDLPPSAPFGLLPENLDDTDRQVGLQPAASHLFRALMGVIPDPADVTDTEIRPAWAQIPSGLVDIATTDLSEIRSIIVAMQTADQDPVYPWEIGTKADFDAAVREWAPPPLNLSDGDDRDRLVGIHEWMKEGLPALSHIDRWDERVRMRAEPVAPNYVGVIGDTSLSDVEQVYRPADQLMLSASNFVPHCTEFIVEWSFGEVYPSTHPRHGQIVWHGLERHVDFDGDGNPMNDPPVAIPYDTFDNDFIDFAHSVPYRLNADQTSFGQYPVGGYSGLGIGSANQSWLIHGVNYDNDMQNDRQLFSFFGYHDPTFDPDDPNRNGNTADAALAESLPWPWPTLMRVTMSLADPNDPSIEETFQFVIELPGNPAP